MATRYWVGGTGSWSSTTKWSTTSGGSSGASVPIATDDVVFNASSGSAFIATVDNSPTCATLTITPSATVGFQTILLATPLTVTGLFSMSGTAGNKRTFIAGTSGFIQNFSVGSFSSLADLDFRDVRVIGAAGTLSGTRIGNRGGNTGITFDAAKTVYWVTLAGGSFSGTNWAATSGGVASTDNFPLAQDTAVIENTGLNTSATVTWDNAIPYTGSINMSSRTNAITFAGGSLGSTVYGNWTNGSGTSFTGSNSITFSGGNTQTITSAGKSFGTRSVIVDSFGGTVQLGDAYTGTTTSFTVTNGTFDTQSYSLTASIFSSSVANVRTITFGSSTVTVTTFNLGTSSLNLTFNANTSTVVVSSSFAPAGLTYYNLTLSPPASAGTNVFSINSASITSTTITGTLTCAGAAANRRVFLNGVYAHTITAGAISANDCDFYNITIAGAAAGSSPTRAGDFGNNAGITFPVAKTVYWNLAGTQNWSDTGWATSSGGVPAANNFPLAQDTAVFDNAGSAGTVTVNVDTNVGSINASGRTSAMTFSLSSSTLTVYGNLTFGSGVSTLGSGLCLMQVQTIGTKTITTNGVSCDFPITILGLNANAICQLGSALTLGSTWALSVNSGTFDAVTYNVTAGSVSLDYNLFNTTVKMGTGTWTVSGTGTVWNVISSNVAVVKNTANIVLSDTSTTSRQFTGGSLTYNKLTIGGTTGTSTTTIVDNNFFTELASTKTVAHTIDFGTYNPTFGAWTVSGTVGNVVTLTGAFTIIIAGARVSGVNYLSNASTGSVSSTSPGEFYAGANSTNPGGGTGFILTAAPAAVTRYWRGGTGTWDATTTTNWSATSGGSGGASVPTSADAVVFNPASSATSYTVTCTATQLRCAAITFAGPASGNVFWAGTAPLAVHGNFTLPASGLTRTYTGALTFSGSTTGKIITSAGNSYASTFEINGVGCEWTLLGALTTTGTFTLTTGSLNTSNFLVSTLSFATSVYFPKSLTLGSTTWTTTGTNGFYFGIPNLTLSKGTSTLAVASSSGYFTTIDYFSALGTLDVNNLSYTGVIGFRTLILNASLTVNTLSIAGATSSAGQGYLDIAGNQTITTLTLSAGTNATYRTLLRSNTLGTPRTLTVGTVTAGTTDYDFRDITIAGAAAPVSGTRLGDCKGNSGITFGAGVNKYWNLAAGGNWSAIGWATSSGGSPAINNFPLAQDTAIFEATGLNSGATITINDGWQIGTINMSARTSNTMILATGTTSPFVYGNWINGTGTTLSGTGTISFSGQGSQTLTSAGIAFTQQVFIGTPGGSLTLQDAYNNTNATTGLTLNFGTINLNGFNATLTGAFSSSISNTRTLAIGSGTLSVGGTGSSAFTATLNGFTVTGTGTISMTGATAKTFSGVSNSFSGITLNQGGAGALTISGNNTFKDITNTYSATGASSILFAATTQRLTQFTGSGASTRLFSISGTSAASFARLIITGGVNPNVDYITPNAVRAYVGNNVPNWYIGTNSTNGTIGSLGFVFAVGTTPSTNGGNFFFFFM